MKNEKLIHDWIISYLKDRLTKNYDDVMANLGDEEKSEFKGYYPDLILGNHGMVLALVEVETENSITTEKADEWKKLTGLGAKLILMVPRASKAKVIELLWKQGLADRTSVGSYDINISMP